MTEKSKISITLDTSCLHPDYPELEILASLEREGKVILFTEIVTELETLNWPDEEKKKKIIRWMQLYAKQHISPIHTAEELSLALEKYCDIHDKVVAIHSPEYRSYKNLHKLPSKKYLSKRNDWKICTYHILSNRDFFVTKNKNDFIGKKDEKKKEKFEKKFNTKIRFLDENFIKELKEIVGD